MIKASAKAANPELFGKYSKSTLYGWIAGGLFSAKKHDLPFAGTRKKPHKKPVAKTNAKCRIGRTIKEMREYCIKVRKARARKRRQSAISATYQDIAPAETNKWQPKIAHPTKETNIK